MRTTVTFDDDVARLIRDAQHRDGKSFKAVINDAIRQGLTQGAPTAPPYRHRTHHSKVRPGIEVNALNRVADDLDDEALLGRGGS